MLAFPAGPSHDGLMKQAFFFDIDGTLYRNQYHSVSSRTLRALKSILEHNDRLYLCTSRSYHEMQTLPGAFFNLPFTGMICEGGALILNDRRMPVLRKPVDRDSIQKIQQFCLENGILWRYACDQGNWFDSQTSQEIRDHWMGLYLNAPGVKPWQGEEVYNILLWKPEAEDVSRLQQILPELDYTVYPKVTEIHAPGVSKEAAVKWMLEQSPCEKSFAFGDGLNDIEMLRTVDMGLAMASGCEEVRLAADAVIGTIEEDGCAQWLESRGYK